MASRAIILAAVNRSLEMASNWCQAFITFVRMIGFAVVAARKTRRSPESSSPSWSSSSKTIYEVFLSFRGADTRTNFTDHLYDRLKEAGIRVFRDEEELSDGEEIKAQLKEAIKGSKISIAVFSKDYASSRSCLTEVAQMWECRESNGHTIIPIFYDVTPHDVKRQAGDFGRSFDQHVRDGVNEDTIKTWKNALRRIGALKGFDRPNINGGLESHLVKRVLRRVRRLLKKDDQVVTDKLVGIDLHVQEVMRKLGVVYTDGQEIQVSGKDVRVLGIWGMRGVGKTTLAKVVFNKIHVLFDECSFVADINSREVVSMQKLLIASLQKRECEELNSRDDGIKKMESLFRNMKVLIVLDDVRNGDQIEALAGNLNWFGPGSRIIVTTDFRNVLNGFEAGAVEEYKVGLMRHHHHALQLFRKHAFQGDAPQDVNEYDSLSIDIAKAIGLHPKAIIHQASSLSHKRNDIEKWRETLECLPGHPPKDVRALFDAGYESLDHHTKEIFLDIACFFAGSDVRIATYMWKACDCYPPTGIDPLRDLHWVEDGENNELRMDNLIRDIGREIVTSKAPRCRFWNHSEALSILKYPQGTESVQGIYLPFKEGSHDRFTLQLQHMSSLRYLRLDQANIKGDTGSLPPNLRWLVWQACGVTELRIMHLEKLVILDLSWSSVTKDSLLQEPSMKMLKELKVLNLQGCFRLCASLDFPAPANLEMLILQDCTLITQIEPFIRNLNKLRTLNLKGCARVKKLPEERCFMESMRELVIDGTGIQGIHCQSGFLKNLETLSARDCKLLQDVSAIGHLRNLSSLALDGADIDGLPDSFEFPQTLKRLSLRECRKLVKLPPSIGKLKVLEVMDLSDTGIKEIPQSVNLLRNLKTLKMERTHLQKFPEGIVNLEKLEEIDFSSCRSLGGQVPCGISGLSNLRILKLSSSEVAGLPQSICRLPCLQTLDILKCDRLHTLPKLPSSLRSLRWGCTKMAVPDLSYLTNLEELLLTDGEQPKARWRKTLPNLKTPNIRWIARLPSLETLQLSLSRVTNLPRNFSALTQLRELSLSHMKKLDLTQLPSTSSLSTLHLKHCKIRRPEFSGLKYLSELELDHCNLAEIGGLGDLKLLEVLKISHCWRITNLSGLQGMGSLRKVQVHSSPLVVLPELSERVEVDRCNSDTCPYLAFFSASGRIVSVLYGLRSYFRVFGRTSPSEEAGGRPLYGTLLGFCLEFSFNLNETNLDFFPFP